MRILLPSVVVLLFLFACTEEQETDLTQPDVTDVSYPGVDERLWSLYARFESEADIRGIAIDLREMNVTGTIEPLDTDDENVVGLCQYHSNNPNDVFISASFWEEASPAVQEFVVFHELGHCALLRDHREAENIDGSCASIMASGNGECLFNYTSNTRRRYLDELFDEDFRGDWLDDE